MKDALYTACRVQRSGRVYLKNNKDEILAAECRNCGSMKPVGDFHTHKGKATRLQTYCRPCDHAIRKQNYKKKVAAK